MRASSAHRLGAKLGGTNILGFARPEFISGLFISRVRAAAKDAAVGNFSPAPNQKVIAPNENGNTPLEKGNSPFENGNSPFEKGNAPFEKGNAPFAPARPQREKVLPHWSQIPP